MKENAINLMPFARWHSSCFHIISCSNHISKKRSRNGTQILTSDARFALRCSLFMMLIWVDVIAKNSRETIMNDTLTLLLACHSEEIAKDLLINIVVSSSRKLYFMACDFIATLKMGRFYDFVCTFFLCRCASTFYL